MGLHSRPGRCPAARTDAPVGACLQVAYRIFTLEGEGRSLLVQEGTELAAARAAEQSSAREEATAGALQQRLSIHKQVDERPTPPRAPRGIGRWGGLNSRDPCGTHPVAGPQLAGHGRCNYTLLVWLLVCRRLLR